jgi:hypothetical protein
MSITLDELFDTHRETTLGEVAELRHRAWADEALLTRVEVYENDALMCVTIPFIGFAGVLIDRATGRQIDMGSGISAAHHVWAHELGVDLEGTNDVLIRGFTDRPRLKASLGLLYTRRHVVRRILPNLGDLPIMLRGLALFCHPPPPRDDRGRGARGRTRPALRPPRRQRAGHAQEPRGRRDRPGGLL